MKNKAGKIGFICRGKGMKKKSWMVRTRSFLVVFVAGLMIASGSGSIRMWRK